MSYLSDHVNDIVDSLLEDAEDRDEILELLQQAIDRYDRPWRIGTPPHPFTPPRVGRARHTDEPIPNATACSLCEFTPSHAIHLAPRPNEEEE